MGRVSIVSLGNGSNIEYIYDNSGNRKSYLATTEASRKSENLLLANGQIQYLQILNPGSAGASYDWYRNGVKFTTTSEPRLPASAMTPGRAGAYRVVIREASGAVSVVELLAQLKGLDYESWLTHAVGPAADPSDPGMGRSDSALGDGVSNILKYAMGKGPQESAHAVLPKPAFIDTPQGRRFGIRLTRILDPADVSITIQGSSDLKTWKDVTGELETWGNVVPSANGLTEMIELLSPYPITDARSGDHRYLRVAVTPLNAPKFGTASTHSGMSGQTLVLSLPVSGVPASSFDWYLNGQQKGQTALPQFSINPLTAASAGTWHAIAHSGYGNATSAPFVVQVGGLIYGDWLSVKVGGGVTAGTPGYGRSEVPMGDGFSNLFKYAFGAVPQAAVQSRLPVSKLVTLSGAQYPAIEFDRLLSPADIQMRIEASGNLLAWRDVTAEMVSSGASVPSPDGLSERVTFRCPVSLAQAESQNWRYLRVAVTDLTPDSPTVLLSDDFNDGTIDTTKWTAMGNTVQEQDGYLKLLTNQTDAGGKVYSSTFLIPSNGLTLTRKARVHYSNTYSIPSIRIGYRDGANQEMTVFSVLYGNMSYNGGVHESVYGTFLSLGNGNPHDKSLRYLTVQGPAVIWDTWFDEKITYDRQSGLVRYSRNGVESITGTAPIMPEGASVYVTMNGWGWNTGHWHHCDDLLIKSGSAP